MLLALGIVILISGLGRLFILMYEWKREKEVFTLGTSTEAEIVDRVTYPNDDSLQSSQYRLIARYTDSNGEIHLIKSRGHVCGAESRELLGSTCHIKYLEDDPERAVFMGDQRKHLSYWAFAGNTITAALGLLFILAYIFQ